MRSPAASPPDRPRRFDDGELVAGRFDIVRFIASGGTGEVYEAFDRELEERIALKTLHPEMARDEKAVDRFRREAQLARRVTHPNICRIFDVFHHHVEGSGVPPEDVTFVTMELLLGETLRSRLGQAGRLDERRALPIIRQVATALDAAHEAGVVHRDLTSGNVILVDSPRGERAVVTDFGLARMSSAPPATEMGLSPEDSGAPIIETRPFVGTPAYMAPEQIDGGLVDAAADIYGLGVLIYEMVTARFPFRALDPFALAVERLRRPPKPPRQLVAELEPVWEDVILKCLEQDPERRYRSGHEVVTALEGAGARRWFYGTIAAVVALVLGVVLLRTWLPPTPPADPPPEVVVAVDARPALAVLGFKNLAERDDAAWLSTALSEMLVTELAAGGEVRIVPGENVARMKLELALPEAELLAVETLERIHSYLGTELVVLGSYFVTDGGNPPRFSQGEVRIDLRLQDAKSGDVRAAMSEQGSVSELPALIAHSGADLRRALGIDGDIAVGEQPPSGLPTTGRAVQLYAEGLQLLRLFDARGARDILQEAVEADPSSALAHSALAEAWSVLGHQARAEDVARRAFELAVHLAAEERFFVEGRYREAAAQWEEAVGVYRKLREIFPDNLEYGLRLSRAETAAGHSKEAIATLARLRRELPWATGDPRIDLAEATAHCAIADYARCRDLAGDAAQKGEDLGARLVVARAHRLTSRASRRFGDFARAIAGAEEAKRLFAAVGDRSGVAHSLTDRALIAFDQDELVAAEEGLDQAVVIFRELGDVSGTGRSLNNLASVYLQRGNLDSALELYREAAEIGRETGSKQRLAGALANIGYVLQLRGDPEPARDSYGEALALAREISSRALMANLLGHIGEIHFAQARLEDARAAYDEALEITNAIGQKMPSAFTRKYIADLELAAGRYEAAREHYEAAVATQREAGAQAEMNVSRLGLAKLALVEGRPQEAVAIAHEAATVLRRHDRVDDEAQALLVLIRALSPSGDQGGDSEAELDAVLKRASVLEQRTESRPVRLRLGLVASRVLMARGRAGEARQRLGVVLLRATAANLERLAMEASLELGRAELALGEVETGRERLRKLQETSASVGFLPLAAAAAEALGAAPG